MNLQEVVQWMMDNSYMERNAKGVFILTKSLQNALKLLSKTTTLAVLPDGKSTEVAVVKTTYPLPEKINTYMYQDWVSFYMKFIQDCGVPARMEGTHGNVYSGNKYSEAGMIAFQKAIKAGYQYNVLGAAVSLYYKSPIRMKKAIGSYMESGEWRSDYDMLMEKAEQGIEELNKHVKDSTHDNRGTSYEFG